MWYSVGLPSGGESSRSLVRMYRLEKILHGQFVQSVIEKSGTENKTMGRFTTFRCNTKTLIKVVEDELKELEDIVPPQDSDEDTEENLVEEDDQEIPLRKVPRTRRLSNQKRTLSRRKRTEISLSSDSSDERKSEESRYSSFVKEFKKRLDKNYVRNRRS